MVFPASPLLQAALAASHEMTVEVVILRDGDAIPVNTSALNGDPDGPGVTDLSCQATLGTQGGRSASLTVDRTLLDAGLFDPLVDDVVIRSGVRGIGDVPLFTGRVDSVDDDETGKVEVTLMSRADELKRARFETPYASNRGLSTTEQMRAIIQSVNSGWSVQTSVADDPPVPTATWEDDPGQALDDLATGINALWAPDRSGDFRIFTNPYVLTAEPEPVAVLRDGDDGVLVKVRHIRSREQIHNSVTVLVERTDGLAPIRVTARDTDPTSATLWGGPFGKQNEIIKTQTTLNRANATILANRRLTQSLALARSWSITLPPGIGQLFDPGDFVAVWYRGEVTAQVVESVRYAGHARSTVVADTRLFRTITPLPQQD